MSAYSDKDCDMEPIYKVLDPRVLTSAEAVYLIVAGMSNSCCATRINNSLLTTEGVFFSEVIQKQHIAAVAYDPAAIEPLGLIQTVECASNGQHQYKASILAIGPASEAIWNH